MDSELTAYVLGLGSPNASFPKCQDKAYIGGVVRWEGEFQPPRTQVTSIGLRLISQEKIANRLVQARL